MTRLSVLLSLALAQPLSAQEPATAPHPIGIEEYITTPVVGDPRLSPDGSLVAYTVTTASLQDNRGSTKIWLVDVVSGDSWQALVGAGNDRAPRWSPDGRSLALISTREGGAQIWRLPIRGGEARKVTSVKDGVADFVWSPDGKGLYFWTDVRWGDSTEAERRSGPYPTEAKIWTELFYRHWDEWRLGLRSHLFRVNLADGSATDITPFDHDVPPLALGGHDIAISPVGTEVALVYNPDTVVATSTNNDIFLMGPDGSSPQAITSGKGNDNSPQYAPDGRNIAYLSMATPGFESDRQQLMLYQRANGKRTSLTAKWDLSVQDFRWFPDAQSLLVEVEERGGHAFYRLNVADGKTTRVIDGGTNTNMQLSTQGDLISFLRSTGNHPPEVYVADAEGKVVRQLTHVTDAVMATLDVPALESFGFVGAQNDSVFGWVMKPPGFDPAKKYPLIYIVHGGPQGAWLDQWHPRWNYAVFASRGYVVAAVNFHGSTGYGQAFTNSISRNWGSTPYEDLMKGLDRLVKLPYVDSTRVGAAGGSYGGYMIYWMAGHTNRFKALVAHDGIFNPLSMAGTTEEQWFPIWEFGGTPLQPAARAMMERWSPANYISNWSSPMLVVHSQNDFRVDISEGLQAFTALKLRGVPAKFLYFPDENHFVTRPRNRRLWWGTVLDWFDQYLKPRP